MLERAAGGSAILSGPIVSLSREMYPGQDSLPVGQPARFTRSDVGRVPLTAEYFFTAQDSIVRFISYDRDRARDLPLPRLFAVLRAEAGRRAEYESEFERVAAEVTAALGAPASFDSVSTEHASNGRSYVSRDAEWRAAQTTARLSLIFGANTYRVRLTLSFHAP
jgi:hypothetical protein